MENQTKGRIIYKMKTLKDYFARKFKIIIFHVIRISNNIDLALFSNFSLERKHDNFKKIVRIRFQFFKFAAGKLNFFPN